MASWFCHGHPALSPERQVVIRLDDQVIMLILAEHVVYSTKRLEGQCMVTVSDRELEDIIMEIELLEE